MSNLASSWWTALHFSVIRLPCYLLAILCGALLGIKAVLSGVLLYCRGRPHDSWDMDDEQMASTLIRDYQNLLSRLEAPPHSHATCGCGARAADCSYFVFDARAIGIYIPFRGLHVAPSISTLIAHKSGRCSIFSISINGEVMFEASAGLDSWKLAKLYVRQAQLVSRQPQPCQSHAELDARGRVPNRCSRRLCTFCFMCAALLPVLLSTLSCLAFTL